MWTPIGDAHSRPRRLLAVPPAATPIRPTPEQLDEVCFNADGLVPAVVQEHGSGLVLMVAWMNRETLEETLSSGRTVFWSRSRQERWRKGDSSGDRQWVREAYYDCDGDTLLFVVDQEGTGACHTGTRSCFYRAFGTRPGTSPSAPGVDHSAGGDAPAGSDSDSRVVR